MFNDLLGKGFIHKSTSPYASPVTEDTVTKELDLNKSANKFLITLNNLIKKFTKTWRADQKTISSMVQ